MIPQIHTKASYRVLKANVFALFLILICCLSHNGYSQSAFPTAEGFGKNATGGRGGAVIKVTNLNDSGPGSLRQAVQNTSGPRTVVFEVGGTINLQSPMGIDYGDITIAGQTAPGDGILIKGSQLSISASNVIIRYLRFRPGLNATSNWQDGLSIIAWGNTIIEDVIIDHCSMSWAIDENLSMRAPTTGIIRDITVQNSIISEAVYGSLASARCFNKTYYKNLFAHTYERNVVSYYPTDGTFDYEMINNLIYGVGGAGGGAMGSKVTVLNNHYRNSSQATLYHIIVDYLSAPQNTGGSGTYSETYAYMEGNIIPNGATLHSTNVAPYIQSTPFLSSGIIPIDASQVADDILPHVGCSLPNRDEVDIRLINQYNNGNGPKATSGVYPVISGGNAPADTDNDGMPDSWEIANGLNINDASDRNIIQTDGYTNLEYYLNGMTLETLGNQVTVASNDSDNTICEGDEIILTASDASTYQWDVTGETSASITVSPVETTTYTVTGTHSNGGPTQAEITITVNPSPTADAGADTEICFGNATTLTASGGTSYLWNTGETTQSIIVSPTETTTYSVEVFDGICTATDDVLVTIIDLPSVNAGDDTMIYDGESITLTASGADTYLWNTGETTQSIIVSPTDTTTYTVTGFSATCEATDDIVVTVLNDDVSANAGEDTEVCLGDTTTLTATGGTTYLWNTGETTESIDVSPTTDTTYTVTAFSPSGNNQAQDDVLVTVNALPIADAGADTEICFGNATTLTASGGTSYLWNTGETTQSIIVSPTETTTYSVEVFDGICTATDDVLVTIIDLPSVNAGDDTMIYDGESITLTASGADTYLWNTGETTQSIIVSPTDTTTYTVTGFSATCEATDDIVVTVLNDDVSANAGEDTEVCLGDTTTLTATGGTTYLWNTGETTESIDVSPTTDTTYTVTAFSPSGNNQAQDDVLVTVNALPIADAGADTEICFGNATTLTASGGTSYLWNTGETTQSILVSPTETTTYSVEVFDGICTATDDVLVTIIDLPSVNAGDDTMIYDGESITLTASGADTYLWNTGETTESITVSPTNTTTYSVTGFTDPCEATDDIIVTVLNDDVTANAGDDVEVCLGDTTTLTATGGTTYLWSTGETTDSIDVSPTENTTYTVTAFSPSGNNQAQDDVLVTVNALPIADAGADTEICFGNATTLTASGGTSYLWNTGETTQSILVSPTETTTYSVEVFDGICTATDDVLVTIIDLPSVNAGDDTMIYDGESITLTATGANTYLWNTGETTESITVSPTNTTTYSVTGFTDPCEATDDIIVTVLNDDVTANAGDDVEVCLGDTTTLTATGGTTYLWSTGETTDSIDVSPTENTTYTVTAFSPSGNNQAQDDVLVTVNALPIAYAGADTEICFGNATTLTASGGTSYLWNTGETTQSISVSPTETTTYSVEVFDGICTATDDVLVTIIDLPSVNAGDDTMIYDGESITLTASGADTYLWNTGETTQSIIVSPTDTTTYTVTGFSATCEATDDIVVTVLNDDVSANAGEDTEVCLGDTTTLTATGGTTYLWNTGETTESIDVSPTTDTTYTVTAFSPSGNNQAQDDVLVTVNALPIADAGADTEICFGNATTLTASGGTSYLWNTGETTQSISVSPTETTTYSVEVFDGTCTATDDILVTIIPLPTVDAGDNVGILTGESTTLTASGADTYLWNTGETTQSIIVSPTDTTTYTVTGFLNGCEATDNVTVEIITETVIAEILGGDFSICEGNTVILTATGGASYFWNTGETTASIEVSPTETTIYTVTAFSPSGSNQDEDSVTITVFDIPEANAGEDVELCLGETTLLTASGGTSYLWNTGETTASISVNPTESTSYSVEVFNTNCSGIDDVFVTVNPLPNVNTSNDITISEGESTTLSATGANTYLWSTGETGSSIVVSPNSTVTYTVTGYINGCEASDQVIVTVEIENVTANAGSDVEICNGESTVLFATGGTSYLWSTGETTANITVNPNTTTTYSVTVFNAAETASDEDSVTVTVNELPETNAGVDVTISEGESTTLNATGADTYLWSTGETSASIVVSPNTTTTYSVTGFANGCEATDDTIVTVEPSDFEASAGENRTICEGYETTLTASAGDSYLWSTGETTQSITVNPVSTQTYSVTVFQGDNQGSANVTVEVDPNPNVIITNGEELLILEGEFVTLSASGADTYLWNNGATQPNIAVSPSITTNYEVTGYTNDCEDTKAVMVNVLRPVIADAGQDVIICADEIVTLTATGGEEFLWNTGETTQSIEVSPNVDTEYSVLVYNALSSDEDTVTVFVEQCATVEIPESEEGFGFLVYQESESDILKVRIDGLQDFVAKGFSIYDVTGNVLYTETFDQDELEDQYQLTREIRTDLYADGIYMVRFRYDDTSLVKKIPIN